MVGVVTHWNDKRGFGFIKPDGGGEDIFVHVKQLKGARELTRNQRVQFGTRAAAKGPEAVDVRTLD